MTIFCGFEYCCKLTLIYFPFPPRDFMGANTCIPALGFVLYYPTSFQIHLALRGLLGIVSVSVTYAGLILAIEFVDGKWRTIAGMYNLFPLPVSYMVISGIAYLTQDYRLLQICIALPGLFLCFLW